MSDDPDPLLHAIALALALARTAQRCEEMGMGVYFRGGRLEWRRYAEVNA